MNLTFHKYQGTGNDFILIDNRDKVFNPKNNELIKQLCDRRFGIGADGLMLLENHTEYDFEMLYFNADGYEGSMCGNGGRCIVAFAHYLGICKEKTRFIAVDGMHDAMVIEPNYIKIKMNDVSTVEMIEDSFYLNTGSPHYVSFCQNLQDKDVYNDGRNIRYNERFKKVGTNVNFVEILANELFVRTYERGVENETFSCGTGIVASAISAAIHVSSDKKSYNIKALGGNLKVSFERKDEFIFKNVWLEGKAERVFGGTITV